MTSSSLMPRPARILALLTLIFSILWLVFLITLMITAGPLDTLDQVLAHVSQPGALFTLTYVNAALITLSATAWFTVLYGLVRAEYPTVARVGLVFIPVYCTLNLFAYLSQITILPGLLPALRQPESAAAARLLLGQIVQEWPSSGVAFFNGLAYALLGIPSILYGLVFARRKDWLRTGGILLALSGLASILGVIGVLAHIAALSPGSLVGGILFITALPFFVFGGRHAPAAANARVAQAAPLDHNMV